MNDFWNALGQAERFKIALAVARRRGREWVRLYDNVISVGAGMRVAGKGRDLQDEVCLRFLVSKKWRDARIRNQSIPPTFAAYVLIHGKRVRVNVPTDVAEFKGGKPHGLLNLTGGLSTQVNGTILLGSACCLVRNVDLKNERYLLSCYHVFSQKLATPPLQGTVCHGSEVAFTGSVTDAAQPSGEKAVDAALVRVTESTTSSVAVWGITPRDRATDSDLDQLPERGQLQVLGRRVAPAADGLLPLQRTGPIPAVFSQVIPGPTPFDYRSSAGRIFEFCDVIEYKAAVRPGDSGSALVGVQDGMLYGMHFYGQDDFGYALSAPRLFAPDLFGVNIELL